MQHPGSFQVKIHWSSSRKSSSINLFSDFINTTLLGSILKIFWRDPQEDAALLLRLSALIQQSGPIQSSVVLVFIMMVEQFEVINSILHTIYGRSWLYWPFQKMEQLEAGLLETALLDLESNFERRIDEIWKKLCNSWFLSWIALWARLFAIQERPYALVKFLNVDDHSMIQLPLAGMSLAVYKFIHFHFFHFFHFCHFWILISKGKTWFALGRKWEKVRKSQKLVCMILLKETLPTS